MVDDDDGWNERGPIKILRHQRQTIVAPHLGGVVLDRLKSVAETKEEEKRCIFQQIMVMTNKLGYCHMTKVQTLTPGQWFPLISKLCFFELALLLRC